MKLASYLLGGVLDVGLDEASIEALFRKVTTDLKSSGVPLDVEAATSALIRREGLCSTGVGNGIAIPHATLEGLCSTHIAVATLAEAMDFHSIDDKPVSVIFMLLGPPGKPDEHAGLLARISRICSKQSFISQILCAETSEDLRKLLLAEDEKYVG
jgi:mannitol/fructose-specific phosphotransferase system IIA component (Ntr-type)